MPRPTGLFKAGDPITAEFTFVRWIGDRKGIEERTKIWNQTIIDRTEDLREWAKILTTVVKRVNLAYLFANNHYSGYAPDAIELFRRLWPQEQASNQRQI